MATLRTRLTLSATPGLDLSGWSGPGAVYATGGAGTIDVTVPPVIRSDSFRTVLGLTGTPWLSYVAPTMLGASGTGQAGFLDVIFDSAIEVSSIGRTMGVGFFNLSITGATNASGIEATGDAGSITVADNTSADSADAAAIASTAAVGTLDCTGAANVEATGAQASGVLGSIFTGEAFTISAAEGICYAGTIEISGAGAVTPTGVQSQGFADEIDFDSRYLVDVIRITAYIEVN
jgi:hypothetical protein